MIIYGVALLAACCLAGQFLGELLGQWCGVQANLGGVGFSMLLLMAASRWLPSNETGEGRSASGILFWSAMYVPIVVAMAAQQNVVAAVRGGPTALAAGGLAAAAGFVLVPVLCRLGGGNEKQASAEDAR